MIAVTNKLLSQTDITCALRQTNVTVPLNSNNVETVLNRTRTYSLYLTRIIVMTQYGFCTFEGRQALPPESSKLHISAGIFDRAFCTSLLVLVSIGE